MEILNLVLGQLSTLSVEHLNAMIALCAIGVAAFALYVVYALQRRK